MKPAKKIALTIVTVILCVLIMPVIVICADVLTPVQFADTYYGELQQMLERLTKTSGKKIVIIGNSNVAFGVDSALLEDELRADGLDYTVCNFGLYGSIGTKAMLELSVNHIGEGDLVIFTPELNRQAMSTYFSAAEIWRAADGARVIVKELLAEAGGQIVGNYPAYVAEKISYANRGGATVSGVYSRASFDGNCDMKNADRDYNIMLGGYDANNPIDFGDAFADESFFGYVNGYYSEIRERGADMVFSFSPMNRSSLVSDSSESVNGLYVRLDEALDCKIISNPNDYILDYEWFYDSNFHLNSSGMKVRTLLLAADIKNEWGITTPLRSQMPEKPAIRNDADIDADEGDVECFTYSLAGNDYVITGLTEEGAARASLTLPVKYDGKNVVSFTADTFAGNSVVQEIIIQENIKALYDGSFSGCASLQKIVLRQSDPEKISVGYGLLDGASCKIYVPQDGIVAYSTNYFWGHYAGSFQTY